MDDRGLFSIARRRRCAAGLAALLAATSFGASAAALEPRSWTEPDVLAEPAEVTRVVDAWDESGGIDLHFTLGYHHSWRRATILREVPSAAVGPGGSLAREPVANLTENTSRLNMRADLGLYRDLALILKVPIILSRSATLGGRGSESSLDGAPGVPLFALPFGSPNRSGVEYLGIGIDWGILNQYRDGSGPSLLVGAEARFSISEPMHACGPAPLAEGQTEATMRCTYPSDINRNGIGGEFPAPVVASLEGELPGERRRAGVSRGTTAIDLHAAASRRFSYFEPYLVLGVLFELPDDDSDFGSDRPWADAPPVQGRFSLGTEYIPWELVEQYQRLSLDLRFTGTYRSRGRDYSELFDALGSSGAISYRRPNFAGYVENPDLDSRAAVPSIVDPSSERVFATGLTEVEAHGNYALRVTARWQAGQYVHFDIGGALARRSGAVRHGRGPGDGCAGRAGPQLSPRNGSAGPALPGGYGPQHRHLGRSNGHVLVGGTRSTRRVLPT
jgi:hypothetical protein